MNVLQAVIALIISILMSRALGPSGRGDYILVLLITGTLALICNPAIYASANYYLSTGQWSSSDGFQNVMLSSLFAGALASLGSVAVLFIAGASSEVTGNWWSIAATAVLAGSIVISSSFSGLFYGTKRIVEITTWKIVWSILQLLTFGILFFLKQPVAVFIVAFAFLSFIDAVTMVFLFIHLEKVQVGFSAKLIKPMLAYGLPVYASRIVLNLGQRADSYLVFWYLGSALLGVYSIGTSLSEQMWLMPQAITMVMMPNLGPLHLKEAASTTRDVVRVSALLTVVVMLGASIVMPLLIPLLYGQDFTGAALPFLLRLPGTAAIGIYMIMEPFFQSRGWPKLPLWISIFGLLSNLILDVLLIPPFAMTGAALASTIPYIFQLGLALLIFQNKTDLPFHSLLRIDLVIRQGYRYLHSRLRNQETGVL